ncbi:acetylglutamate kinase [Methylophilaceae bacterium]|jgi:acetylglutamate kinase|nr:acetylglutamate kinase [Methylophilaceae bacterium]|tara:strand:+ start:9170 stop:10027 length:858 start_codon:yes stop_codon:yes gene_type:complete
MTPNEKSKILSEALPYIKQFFGKTIVIKFGGNAMVDKKLKSSFAKDVVLLKLVGMNPVIIHGGGPQINESLNKAGKKSVFEQGIRVTDQETMRIVSSVLNDINKQIVALIRENGGDAKSYISKDNKGIIKAKKIQVKQRAVDLGYVGEIVSVDTSFMKNLTDEAVIPIITSIGIGNDNKIYNINADVVASKFSEVLKAEKLVLMTNTKGVLDRKKNLITGLIPKEIKRLIDDGTISEGMLPKINSAVHAAKHKVNAVHIIDGRVEHALLLEILTDQGVGTLIKDQ